MSRSFNPAALRALFSQDADESLICLLTITGPDLDAPIRLSDNYLQRLSETAEDVLYGVVSRGEEYTFLPLQITLPGEDDASAPRFGITIHDVTRILLPTLRGIQSALSVTLELVLSSSPDTVEASFPGFLMSSISYDANTISAELTVESLAIEPFPSHTFTPAHFPGLF